MFVLKYAVLMLNDSRVGINDVTPVGKQNSKAMSGAYATQVAVTKDCNVY